MLADLILSFLLGMVATNLIWLAHDKRELKKLDKALASSS